MRARAGLRLTGAWRCGRPARPTGVSTQTVAMEQAAAACLLAVLLAGAPAALATRNLLQPGAPRRPSPATLRRSLL